MIMIICIILQRPKSFDFVFHINKKINLIESKISELSNVKHTFLWLRVFEKFAYSKIETKYF